MRKAVFPVCISILVTLAVVSAAAAQTPGEIVTLAGNGKAGYSGDGGTATSAEMFNPFGVAVDRSGNVYIADYENNCVRKVTASTRIITTAAGICLQGGYSGDGGPATSASLSGPIYIALDGAGNLYIADAFNARIRKVTASTGTITTVAGDGTQGFSGDGGLAIYAQLNQPWGIAVDAAGNLYFADQNNNRIRKVTASTGVITTIAGTGTASYSGDGGPATSADLDSPSGIAVDAAGNVFILVNGGEIIRKITATTGIIEHYAGNGTGGFSGDEGPAASAELYGADDVAVDGAGNLYIADTGNNRIRKVDAATHIITTVAGDGYIAPNTGSGGFSGNGGPATSAALNVPGGVVLSGSGDMFIADSYNNRVREVFPGGLPGTATSLSVPASPAIYGTTMELTAQVTGTPGGPTPTGTVTFYDASGIQIIVLGSATLNSSGTASYFTKTLSAGYHIVYATYNGSASYGVSSSASSTLTVMYAAAPPPTFYPPPGTYQSRVQVALWDGAGLTGIASPVSIFYTTDGSTPTPTHGTQYNGAITVNASETFKAIAYAPALANNPSPVSTANYVIHLPAESPLPAGEWAWEAGADTINAGAIPCGEYGIGSGGNLGSYGILGVAAASNTPGSRTGTMNWTDKNGNLWLFGGFGFPSTGTCASLNDLWMFNVTSLQWTWMGGSNNEPNGYVGGVYGALGQFAAGNIPGGRSGGVTWTDASGNFWLFGGSGNDSTGASGELNDVWEYNPSTHQWAWMAGSKFVNQRAYFSNFGLFHSGNTPGARDGAVSFTDSSGNFWLFGGYGYDAVSNEDYLSDLWEFNPSTRQWAWMGGSHYADKFGSYGTQGVPSVRNHPGGRTGHAGWVDKNGDFWLFGGYGYAAWGDSTYLNDMWEYNPRTLQWTWITGYEGPGTAVGVYAIGQPGAYGTLHVPEPGNTPGSRASASFWTDKNGNLWLIGGVGFDAYGGGNVGDFLNDLWEFVPATRMWAWMGGSDTVGLSRSVYGQFRVPSAANLPSSRWGSSTWTDKSGNLWLFGGEDDAKENDLWKYQLP